MMAAVFEILVTSSVLIVGIFGLRKLTMRKISMRLRYGLWLLVAARLLMPLSLGTSPVSVMNLFQDILQESAMQGGAGRELFRQESNVLGAGESGAAYTETAGTAPSWQNPAQEPAGQTDETVSVPDKTQSGSEAAPVANAESETAYGKRNVWQPVTAGVWILGVLSVSGYLFWMRFRFVRYLRRNRREISEEGLPNVMGEKLARRGMRVYRVKGLPSPCLVGRHIYIGEETPGGEQGMLHVLAHEYSHALHGDGFWAFLRCALAALWWFDPLVWAAAFAARQAWRGGALCLRKDASGSFAGRNGKSGVSRYAAHVFRERAGRQGADYVACRDKEIGGGGAGGGSLYGFSDLRLRLYGSGGSGRGRETDRGDDSGGR